MTEKANIGVVGLAVMGSNLARNLASREGNKVAVYNRSTDKTQTLTNDYPEANFIAAETIDDLLEVWNHQKPQSSWFKLEREQMR
jgi:6-phosphogluconate dehydrogenase